MIKIGYHVCFYISVTLQIDIEESIF